MCIRDSAQCGSRGRDFDVADASGFDHFTGQTGGGDPLRFIKYIKDETIRYREKFIIEKVNRVEGRN